MVKINGMAITGNVNAEPKDGDYIMAEGAAEGNVDEYQIVTAGTLMGEFKVFPLGGSTSFAGIAPRKVVKEVGGTDGRWVDHDSMGRVVSGIYPARIEKTQITANQELLRAGSLVDASTHADGVFFKGVGNPLARMIDDLEFEAANDAQYVVAIARVVLP